MRAPFLYITEETSSPSQRLLYAAFHRSLDGGTRFLVADIRKLFVQLVQFILVSDNADRTEDASTEAKISPSFTGAPTSTYTFDFPPAGIVTSVIPSLTSAPDPDKLLMLPVLTLALKISC